MHFSKSLAETNAALIKYGVDVQIHFSLLSCFVDMSRNTLVSEFLKTDSTHLLFIDDDMGWDALCVFQMLAHDVDFVAGVGPKKSDSGDEYCCHINVNADETPIVKNGLISASHVGGAFCLLKRQAIERMIKKFPDLKCRAVNLKYGYHFYETKYSENSFISEDYLFCDRFIEAGGDVWIYPNINFYHTGVKDYKGNYHEFLLGTPKEAAEPELEGLKYSIVIVAYKAEEALFKCLKSLAVHAPLNSEIILVDNTLKPIKLDKDLIFRLKKNYTNVVIISDGKNYGFAKGCNIGVSAAKGNNIVFVNPDTIVFSGWAEGMFKHLLPGVGAVGPISNFVAGWQNYSLYKDAEDVSKITDWDRIATEVSNRSTHKGIETKLLIGFFLMVPRRVWDAVGVFDEKFVLGCDDLDYSLRLQKSGFKLMIAQDVFIYHEGHASFNDDINTAFSMNQESEIYMREKLKSIYGDSIPSSTDLWGCEIFKTETNKEVNNVH